MVRIHAPTRNNASGLDQRRDMGTAAAVRRRARIAHFWLHFVEMSAAMCVGMAAGVGVFLAVTGFPSYRQALLHHPVQALLVMAISMALPMAGWMLLRGHGWRNSAEMAAAMIVPAIPFVILAGLHVIGGTACRAYMPLSVVAMIGLMVYRRDAYSMPMPPPWRRHPHP
jgi:hypothetical protein